MEEIQKSWGNSSSNTLNKLSSLSNDLTKWSKITFGHVTRKLQQEKQNLLDLQARAHLTDTREEEKSILNKIEVLTRRERMFWEQRNHSSWVPNCDKNTQTECNKLSSIPSSEEIFNTIRKMSSVKSPRPDGYPSLFYKNCWHIIGPEVTTLIQDCFRYASLPPGLNHTFLALVPKVKNPSTPAEYRPIALWNVLYKRMERDGMYAGYWLNRWDPFITHIIFDDDVMLSGVPNNAKISSTNITSSLANSCASHKFLVEKFDGKLIGWKRHFLSHVGRTVLIQYVVALLPIYFIAVSIIPKEIINKLNQTIRNFWWGHSREQRKMHYLNWDWFTTSKEKDGLGLRSLELLNKALIAKLAWRFLRDSSSLWVVLLKAKYLRDVSFWTTKKPQRCSTTWAAMLDSRKNLKEGFLWLLDDGSDFRIWTDP
ncbi:uncharacterized protein LOC113324099 [Papaver somniferum]|uniref:uncharacterized protein LOC113324099 n=1 Tax=Papaver somniferum TaxID=3469 RepID=UPI000E703C02|nr:uncharacterized protein LOC113324099 [Papaver somniferum]